MNTWYFWQQDVVDLADNRFSSDQEYTNYLNSFASPRDLFDDLKFIEDRFSGIVDDFNELLNSFQGVFKTNGVEFGLFRINGGDDLFGIVRYILPNSDASSKNIQRGDLFLSVDGVSLNINNYINLLFEGSDSYTLNMAEISGSSITTTNIDVSLTKQVYTENPILISKTVDVNGMKVGYLMYNGFTPNFDEQLNNAFGDFKANGIDELVLDLRYNLGGSVSSAINISSMITGQFTGDLFLRAQWNDKIQSVLSDASLNRYFVDRLNGNSTTINSLNLNKVYVLAQGSSASASELVINSLDPYINVIHIGDNTRGKNEFSITLLDIPECSYVRFDDCNGSPNPTHTWGIQPLVGRNANSVGFLDYADNGLISDIIFPEDIVNFGILGEIDEPLFARAIQHITGNGRSINPTVKQFDAVSSSKIHTPLRDNMYVFPDTDLLKNIQKMQ
jgi:C-terminal processing protease CtpA/Prc